MNSNHYRSKRTSCSFVTICSISFLSTLQLCEGFLVPTTTRSMQQHQIVQSTPRNPNSIHNKISSSILFSSAQKNAGSKPKRKNSGSKNKSKNKNKNGKGKNKKKHHNSVYNAQRVAAIAATPRPVVTNYQENRNRDINEERLETACSELTTQDFVPLEGVLDRTIGDVEIVRSAKRFFSSTAIRKNRLDVIQSGEDWVIEDVDDGFYEVVVPSDVKGWRTQAKLVAAPTSMGQWNSEGCRFGLYQKGSHKVVEIPDCVVHHPSINRAVEALQKATKKTGTPAYIDDNGLRYVQFQVERTTGKISLTLIWGASDIKGTQPALSRLTKELQKQEPDLWHSMWCHCNDGPGNNIFNRNAKSWHRLNGYEFVKEPLPVGNLGYLHFSPLAFRQGNLDGFDIIANDVARAVPGGSKVCELYAGVGMLGLTALVFHHFQHLKYGDSIDGFGAPLTWIRCSDENPANPRCFSSSLRSLPKEITEHQQSNKSKGDQPTTLGDLMKAMEAGEIDEDLGQQRTGPKASYMVASAAQALKSGQALGADILIVDPPRRGLEDEVLEELCKPINDQQPCVESPDMLTVPDYLVNWTNDVQTLLYVSCGFDALARDCEALVSSPAGWKLESATGYILFPGSNHVETLCVFRRK